MFRRTDPRSPRRPGPSRRVVAAAVLALTLAVVPAGVALASAQLDPDPPVPPAAGERAVPGLTAADRVAAQPTDEPEPTDEPTDDPEPSDEPTDEPSDEPTDEPSDDPADEPTDEPTDQPTDEPTEEPTDEPTDGPTEEPTDEPTDGPAADEPAEPADAKPGDAMPAITVEGNQIMRNGEPWWFLGYNSFVWSGNCGNDDEKMSADDVEQWFSGMRHDGHGAVRLFFYDGWDIDRLDAAVESAKRHNVYLTITLDDAIGGCGENDKEASWFADQSERDVYQAHMETLLERYQGETAFAWFEFFNEPDYEDGALREFFDEMGAAADAVDPDRLFSSGTVAPYWVDGEDNFADIHESPGVDIASLHEYDEGEVESNHGPKVRANSAGKPVIVGEYGITAGDGCDSSFDSRAERFAEKAQAYTSTEDGYAGALAWAWQPGGGGCELGNLDEDGASQEILRLFELDEVVDDLFGAAGDVAGDAAGDTVEDGVADAEKAVEGIVERIVPPVVPVVLASSGR